MKKKRVYISGAISGMTREEYMKHFADAEAHLKRMGYNACNPTKALPSRFLWIYRTLGYNLTLVYDMFLLSRCDYIYMLDGWEQSNGARLENHAAVVFGIQEIFTHNFQFNEKQKVL